MSEYAAERWAELARLLRSRRPRIDPKFKNRGTFCDATGLNYKLVQDIEGAPETRTNFSEESFSLIEGAYRWKPGSIQRVLSGGDPIEIAEVSGQTSVLLTGSAGTIRTRPGQGSIQTDDGLKAALRELAKRLPQHEVRALLEEFAPAEDEADDRYTDPQERHLWRTPGLDARGRRYLIGQLQAYHRLQETSVVDQGEADVREIRKHG